MTAPLPVANNADDDVDQHDYTKPAPVCLSVLPGAHLQLIVMDLILPTILGQAGTWALDLDLSPHHGLLLPGRTSPRRPTSGNVHHALAQPSLPVFMVRQALARQSQGECTACRVTIRARTVDVRVAQ